MKVNAEQEKDVEMKRSLFPKFRKISKNKWVNGIFYSLISVVACFVFVYILAGILYKEFSYNNISTDSNTEEQKDNLKNEENIDEKNLSDKNYGSGEDQFIATNFKIPDYITPSSIVITSEPKNLEKYEPREVRVEEGSNNSVVKVFYPEIGREENILTLGNEYKDVSASLFNNSNKVAISCNKGLFVYDWDDESTKYYLRNMKENTLATEWGGEYKEITWKVESTGQIMKYNDFTFVKNSVKISKDDRYIVSEVVHVGDRLDNFPYTLLIFDIENGNLLNPEDMFTTFGLFDIQFSNDLKNWVYTVNAMNLREAGSGLLYKGSTNDFSNYVDVSKNLKMDSRYDFQYATFSNNNQKIATVYDGDYSSEIFKRQIGIIDVEGNGIEVLPDYSLSVYEMNFPQPIFSPDDKYLYYFTVSEGSDVLVQYNLIDRKFDKVIKFDGSDYVWSDLEFTNEGYLKVKAAVLTQPKVGLSSYGEVKKYFYIILDVKNAELIYSSGY